MCIRSLGDGGTREKRRGECSHVSGGSRLDDADAVLQEAHAIHLEGRGASHTRQPLPGVHEKNIRTLASAAVTTWCYSLLVLSALLFYF